MGNTLEQSQGASQDKRVTVQQILVPCSPVPHLLLQGSFTAQPSNAFLPKDPHGAPVAFGAGKTTAWESSMSHVLAKQL